MKIAITGHTAGIGQALAKVLTARGHEIVGLSKRTGQNIRVIPKIVDLVKDCDMFINNAQAGYAQTELLYRVWELWQGQPKHIWCISTMMTQTPINPEIANMSDSLINEYRNQKIALEDACNQLQFKSAKPNIVIIRPGCVATQPGQVSPWPAADVNEWAESIVAYIVAAENKHMRIKEISLASCREPVLL